MVMMGTTPFLVGVFVAINACLSSNKRRRRWLCRRGNFYISVCLNEIKCDRREYHTQNDYRDYLPAL